MLDTNLVGVAFVYILCKTLGALLVGAILMSTLVGAIATSGVIETLR